MSKIVFAAIWLFFLTNALVNADLETWQNATNWLATRCVFDQQFNYKPYWVNLVKQYQFRDKFLTCRGIRKRKTQEKMVALTFDDGPSIYSEKILKILDKYQVKATFFVIGQEVLKHPVVMQHIVQQGHQIASHTVHHANLFNSSEQKIREELEENQKIIGQYVVPKKYFRPPYGSCSDLSYQIASELGLKAILWSAATDDFNTQQSAALIASKILKLVTPGGIICLHDGGGNRQKSVQALEIILEELLKNGYKVVTLEQLLLGIL